MDMENAQEILSKAGMINKDEVNVKANEKNA